MKQLLLAAVLALAFHSLLFTVEFEGLKAKLIQPPKQLTLSLAQGPAEALHSPAVSRIPEPPHEPPSHRPQPKEDKTQREEIRKREKPSKGMDPSFLPHQEQAGSSTDRPGVAGEEAPVTRTSRESRFPATASLGEGGQGSKPPPVHEAIPLYRQNPVPEYPLTARRRGFQGTVILEVLVDRQGRVADLRLSTSSGYSVLDQAAWMGVKTWLFDPGTRGGEKVDMWVKVPVRFQLQ